MLLFCFRYFGLALWIPELFTRFAEYGKQYPNATITLKHLSGLNLELTSSCEAEFNFDLFKNTLIIGACSIICNCLSGWLIGKVSLRIIPLVTMFLGGISSGCIYFLNSLEQYLILACVFQSSMVTGNMVIGSIVVELFPTNIAAMAVCATLCIGRIGAICSNMVFGFLMDNQCEIPMFLVSAISIIGGVLCFALPPKKATSTRSKTNENSSKFYETEYMWFCTFCNSI